MTKYRGYTINTVLSVVSPCMPKYVNDELVSFGERLAALRKTAGYTQVELADELGVTRRMIVYYERESDYPPTTLLPGLAKALGVTTDALLGLKKIKKVGKGDTRLQRRMQQIEKLPAKDRRQITQIIDTFIKAAQI